MRFLVSLAVGALLLASCASKTEQFTGATEGERINKFFDWSFMRMVEREPTMMAYLGIPKRQDELGDFSEAHGEETLRLTKEHLSMLREFNRDKLSKQDQLSYDLFERDAKETIEGYRWKDYQYPVNQQFGAHSGLVSFMIDIHQIKNKKDAENYIKRLEKFKTAFAEITNQLMRSEAAGVIPPKFVYPKVLSDSRNIISGRPFTKAKKDSPLLKDFRSKLKKLKLSKAEKKKLMTSATQALTQSVQPAYQNLISFLEAQEKRATKDDGVWKFPKGGDFYQFRLEAMTTTELNPEQIHKLGLENVARIHKEMTAIKNKVGFKGDLQAFFKHVKGNKFYFPDNKNGKKAYLKMSKKLISDMEKSLDKMFITKPKASIKVKAVEAYREKSAGMAFYQPPALEGGRPGIYYVNLSNMKALPRWEAAALAYHEGIPGHHMQNSISQETKSLPKFRRISHITAYGEGWGLYSERLPKDFGFYKDPYSDFGRLSMELVRACRLVVDTGLHHKKWTREQAIAYLDKNLPGDHKDNIRQIERYIVMPGQATAYMIGMLKILELREKAQKAMGKKFDIRRFHETILSSGPVPLKTMEKLVGDYIKSV